MDCPLEPEVLHHAELCKITPFAPQAIVHSLELTKNHIKYVKNQKHIQKDAENYDNLD